MRKIFSSPIADEAQLLSARLHSAGFHPVVTGGTSAGLLPVAEMTAEVFVTPEEFDAVQSYLLESKLLLDETQPTGEALEGSVCPVHEGPAIATCDRCGTFLCAKCGSLGAPPLCEECLTRSEPERPRPRWVMNVARVWAFLWISSLIIGLLSALVIVLRGAGVFTP